MTNKLEEIVPVLITVKPGEDLNSMLTRLRRVGLRQGKIVAERLGVIGGFAIRTKIDKLKISGVMSVELEGFKHTA